MKFKDCTEIVARSGDGGSGMVSFRAARNLPKLGADGGDGGHGGSVFARGHKGLNTLSHLYYRKTYSAMDGSKGGSNGKTGACGEHCYVDLPLGTEVCDASTGEVITEVLEDEHRQEVYMINYCTD